MDRIDVNLEHAWNRLSAACRRDRVEALRRFRRTRGSLLRRPPRAWCLSIRASDRRINPLTAVIRLTPRPGEVLPPIDNLTDWALGHGIAHTVTLDGALIRKLTRPVNIPWPGVPRSRAAALLGLSDSALNTWLQRGSLKLWGYDPPACHGHWGRPVSIVYTPSPVDPGTFMGEPPDPIWGTLWQHLWERVPLNYQLTVERVRRICPYRRKRRKNGRRRDIRQRGWSFICPGRLNDDGTTRACGRRVTRLYAPQTISTLANALGEEEGFDLTCDQPSAVGDPHATPIVNRESSIVNSHGPVLAAAPALRLTGQWFPSHTDPSRATGPRSFACRHCWNIRFVNLRDRSCWHEFITYISGGLLYGHEVDVPEADVREERLFKRKRGRAEPRAFRRALTTRRAAVLHGLLHGRTYLQIAQRLRISVQTVNYHAQQLYREHGISRGGHRFPSPSGPAPLGRGVRSEGCRCQLIHKLTGLNSVLPQQRPTVDARRAARRKQVKALLASGNGLTYTAIAEKLGCHPATVLKDMKAMRDASARAKPLTQQDMSQGLNIHTAKGPRSRSA